MRRRELLVLGASTVAVGCHRGTQLPQEFIGQRYGHRVALVSLAIVPEVRPLARTADFMIAATLDAVAILERRLQRHWPLVSISEFAGHPELQAMAVDYPVAIPMLSPQRVLPIVATNERDLRQAQLTPEQTRRFARVTGASTLLSVYSAWGFSARAPADSRFSSPALPQANTVFSFYDAEGQALHRTRSIRVDRRRLEDFRRGIPADQTAATIDEWIEAFRTCATQVIGRP